jgi:hypothetical protein
MAAYHEQILEYLDAVHRNSPDAHAVLFQHYLRTLANPTAQEQNADGHDSPTSPFLAAEVVAELDEVQEGADQYPVAMPDWKEEVLEPGNFISIRIGKESSGSDLAIDQNGQWSVMTGILARIHLSNTVGGPEGEPLPVADLVFTDPVQEPVEFWRKDVQGPDGFNKEMPINETLREFGDMVAMRGALALQRRYSTSDFGHEGDFNILAEGAPALYVALEEHDHQYADESLVVDQLDPIIDKLGLDAPVAYVAVVEDEDSPEDYYLTIGVPEIAPQLQDLGSYTLSVFGLSLVSGEDSPVSVRNYVQTVKQDEEKRNEAIPKRSSPLAQSSLLVHVCADDKRIRPRPSFMAGLRGRDRGVSDM